MWSALQEAPGEWTSDHAFETKFSGSESGVQFKRATPGDGTGAGVGRALKAARHRGLGEVLGGGGLASASAAARHQPRLHAPARDRRSEFRLREDIARVSSEMVASLSAAILKLEIASRRLELDAAAAILR